MGQTGRLLYAVGVGLFGVAMLAGSIQSVRTDGHLPAVDLLGNGAKEYINLLLSRKDYDGAIRELQMQTRMPPTDAETYKLLGQLLADQGRLEEARAQFLELVRLRPTDAEAHSLLGRVCIQTNEPGLAAQCFTQAIEFNPQLPSAYYGLGIARAQMGELAQAEKCFAKAVELAPTYTDAQNSLDRARKELKSLEAAKKKDSSRK